MNTRITPDHWNGWHLDPDIPALTYDTEHFSRYQIDLDRMLTAEDIVFWTIQIGGKGWPGGLDGFVNAVDDLLDPHERICSLRQLGDPASPERGYTPESIREAVAEFIATEVRHHSKWTVPNH